MIKNPFSGKFIAFEGLDGSGLSTQAELLSKVLNEKGVETILTKEPTVDSEAGKKIKEVLTKKEKMKPDEFQNLFTTDRREHLDKIIMPALREGKWVVVDRYFFSSFAYGVSDDVSLDWLIRINDDFVLPDITFILKTNPELSMERIEKKGTKKTLYEKKEKLEKVWKTYEILPERFPNCVVLDGEKPIEEIFIETKKIVSKKLLK